VYNVHAKTAKYSHAQNQNCQLARLLGASFGDCGSCLHLEGRNISSLQYMDKKGIDWRAILSVQQGASLLLNPTEPGMHKNSLATAAPG
jgi:hypothetical protein